MPVPIHRSNLESEAVERSRLEARVLEGERRIDREAAARVGSPSYTNAAEHDPSKASALNTNCKIAGQ